MAGVDEEFGRRSGDDDVGLAGIDADVTPPRRFPPKRLGQSVGIGERLAEDQSAPTQFELDILGHRFDHVRRRRIVQAERDGLGMVRGRTDGGHAAGPVTP